jgi:hypothetical protein
MLKFPNYVELFLLSARIRHEPEEVLSIKRIANDSVDWESFLSVVDHHRLSPIVFQTIDQLRPTGVPDSVYETLRSRAIRNAISALQRTSEIERLSEAFSGLGMQISVLKGTALSQILFGSPNMRHVGDLDVLTTPERLPEQINLLESLGYERVYPTFRLTPYRLSSYVRFRKDFTFRHPTLGDLDLHWRLFDNVEHPANHLLPQATAFEVEAGGIPVRSFGFQDQFLYVAAHGIFDSWMYLKSLADVAAFLRVMTPSEVDDALDRATELDLLTQISAAIHSANEWFGSGITNSRLLDKNEALSRYIAHRTEKALGAHHFMPNRTHVTPFDWLRMQSLTIPGRKGVGQTFGHLVWRPRLWNIVDLPDALFWLYPLLGLVVPPRRHSLDY